MSKLFLILSFKEDALSVCYGILLKLDAIIYMWIQHLYKIFLILSRVRVVDESDIAPFIKRFYVLIGTIMLFFMAYSLLRSIVSNEGKTAEVNGKTILNVVKAVVLLAVTPTLFDFAYGLQNAILEQNTIGKVIVGNTSSTQNGDSPREMIDKGGTVVSAGVLGAFIVPKEGYDFDTTFEDGSLSVNIIKNAIETNGNFWILSSLSDELANEDGVVDYYFVISFVAGCFVVYLLIRFCLSLGIRVMKLLFYEIIAPVPILASVLPDKKKDLLGTWVQSTLTTFLEVFIRIGVLYLIIYIISLIKVKFSNNTLFDGFDPTGTEKAMVMAILILGLIAFARQLPELISKTLGTESGNAFGAKIRDSLKSGGLFAAGAATGTAISSAARNAIRKGKAAKSTWKERKGKDGKEKRELTRRAIGQGFGVLGGLAGGFFSGGVAGYKKGKDANSFGDIRNAAHQATEDTVGKSIKREDRSAGYRAKGKNAVSGRASDAWGSIKEWAGTGSEYYKKKIQSATEMKQKADDLISSVSSTILAYGRPSTIAQYNKFGFDETKWKGSKEEQEACKSLYQKYVKEDKLGLKDLKDMLSTMEQETDFSYVKDSMKYDEFEKQKIQDSLRTLRENAKNNRPRNSFALSDSRIQDITKDFAESIGAAMVTAPDGTSSYQFDASQQAELQSRIANATNLEYDTLIDSDIQADAGYAEAIEKAKAEARSSYNSAVSSAIEKARAQHAQELSKFRTFYSQLEKQSTLQTISAMEEIRDAKTSKERREELYEAYGLSGWADDKLSGVHEKVQDITDTMNFSGGSISYTTIEDGEEKHNTLSTSAANGPDGAGKFVDSVSSAYNKVREENQRKANEIERRKGSNTSDK